MLNAIMTKSLIQSITIYAYLFRSRNTYLSKQTDLRISILPFQCFIPAACQFLCCLADIGIRRDEDSDTGADSFEFCRRLGLLKLCLSPIIR